MKTQAKTFKGFMDLDDPKDTMPNYAHKEARNGTFRGKQGIIKFQSIRGNQKVTNSNLKTNNR